MKCRKMKIWTDEQGKEHRDIVWFGSYGVDDNGKALRANDDYSTKFVAHDNYATEQEGVVNSLIQRLSVIQGELWWQMDYGIPLFSNVSSKAIMDSSIIDMTLEHEDVLEFIDFNSTLENHNYRCNFEVLTTYGNIIVNI